METIESDLHNLCILLVGRDIYGTGGGKVIIESARLFSLKGYNVAILTDYPIPDLEKYVKVVTTPLGNKLYRWRPKSKAGRIIRHFLQIFIFTIAGSYLVHLIKNKNKHVEYIVVNHNIEVLNGDIIVLHNVFTEEWLRDLRPLWLKLLLLINPVKSIRILKEQFVLRTGFGKIISAVSEVTMKEVLPFINKKNMTCVIPNGVDSKQFGKRSNNDRKNVRKELGIRHGDFVLIFVGHEFERKGLMYVIDSLKYLPINVKLLVIGGRGSNIDKYVERVRQLKLNDRVRFLGTRWDVEKYYSASDLFILPSSYETWALVGLEAMACGIPVLMTPTGGIKEYLTDGVNGYFIKQDGRYIAEKVIVLMNNKDKYREMSLAARQTALKYSWESVAEKYLGLIKEIYQSKKKEAK